jgi:hypothetical protein
VSLEAAQCLAPALSLGLFPSEERSRRSMHASLGDGEPIQSAVELTVPLAVQAMALLLARGGIKRSDSGELRELCVVREALHKRIDSTPRAVKVLCRLLDADDSASR